MTLRLNEEDDRLLTERAAAEGRSKQELAQEAIHTYLVRRSELLSGIVDEIMEQDAELLERLA
jgi:predicted transcriptional regulator